MIGFPGTAVETWSRRRIGPVFATGGMIASAHPLVTTSGLEVLQRGGNAVDAAVAAAITAAVVMPEMCGLGGDLFAIVHDPARAGGPAAYLGSGISPRGATIEQMRRHGDRDGTRMPFRGPLAVGVPGMVDGYFALLRNHGTRSFAELAEQAVGYAEGHPLGQGCARAIADYRELLARFPSSAAVFLPGGKVPRAGDILHQPDLAATLRQIGREGAGAFYRGSIGERIDAFMRESGGAMRASDLAGHETTVEAPIATTYRDHTVYQTGLPSQGLILLEALNLVEAVVTDDHDWWSGGRVHLMVEATKLAYADRLAYTADPSFRPSRVTELLDKQFARCRSTAIDRERAALAVEAGELSEGDTTYLTVVDRDGRMVSLIQSVSAAFGCGVVAGDTGIVLNNRVGRGFSLDEGHPNIFEPGKKTMHTLNCWLMANAAGQPVVVGGTPGGDGQPQWNLQMITGLIDGGMDVQAAIEAPRWTIWPGTDPLTLPNPFELRFEDRAGDVMIASLRERGHDVRVLEAWSGGGMAQVIARDPATGVLAGGSDPRAEGLALGF